MSFKKLTPLEKRMQISEKIKEKYPDYLPIVVESQDQSNKIKLKQTKYIVPKITTIGKLLNDIRKNTEKLEPTEAMFIFCDAESGGILAPISKTIDELYDKYKDTDGFLYFVVAKENVFGSGIVELFSNICNGLHKFFF